VSPRPPRLCSLALAGALLLVAAACSNESDAGSPSATVGTAPPTTTTTLPVDQAPNEITVEYVQRVMDELDKAWGDMFRQYMADRGPTPDNLAWLAELYAEPEYSRMEAELGAFAAEQFDGARNEPGSPDTVVQEVIDYSGDCIAFRARRTLDDILEGRPLTDAEAESFLGLSARPSSGVQGVRNPTTWKIAVDSDVVSDVSCS
jgi:hypothetical protein